MAIRQMFWNMLFAGVKATTEPAINLLDCSHGIFLPALLRENVIRAAIPPLAKVNPVICTCPNSAASSAQSDMGHATFSYIDALSWESFSII